jgi:hypothetical protein
LSTTLTSITEETRIRWVQTQTRAESLLVKIKEVINSGIYKAEDTLSHLFALLSGGWEEKKERAKDKGAEGRDYLEKKAGEGRDWADEKVGDARETAGEKIKVGGQKLKGEL